MVLFEKLVPHQFVPLDSTLVVFVVPSPGTSCLLPILNNFPVMSPILMLNGDDGAAETTIVYSKICLLNFSINSW